MGRGSNIRSHHASSWWRGRPPGTVVLNMRPSIVHVCVCVCARVCVCVRACACVCYALILEIYFNCAYEVIITM